MHTQLYKIKLSIISISSICYIANIIVTIVAVKLIVTHHAKEIPTTAQGTHSTATSQQTLKVFSVPTTDNETMDYETESDKPLTFQEGTITIYYDYKDKKN